ncbi:MAG: hypothetical protein EXS18_02025 [Verrucomicrobiae bacterium]|nr:hypothetical protein [Verrucomicrobiae bacterium]
MTQAARLERAVLRGGGKDLTHETESLISSQSGTALGAAAMRGAEREYWGIENGLHLRLDVTAGEDRSRVRQPVSALNLAMVRRATISVANDWIERCSDKRKATLRGCYDAMAAKNARKAFSLVTVRHPPWLPPK